jgi:hypothetical protein
MTHERIWPRALGGTFSAALFRKPRRKRPIPERAQSRAEVPEQEGSEADLGWQGSAP